jgi:hypothetical protein
MVTLSELRSFLAATASASGSIGPYTVSRNRGGTFVRDRVTPAQPATLKQLTAQGRWNDVATDWLSVLSDAQRASWRVYAANVPLTDRLGSKRPITGFQHFMRSNYLRRITHLPQRRDAPTVFNLGGFTLFNGKVNANPARASLNLSWHDDPDWVGEPGTIIFAYVTIAYASTVNSFRPPANFSRYIPAVAASPQLCPMRSAAAAGDHVFWRVRISRWDGRMSYPQRSMTVVIP